MITSNRQSKKLGCRLRFYCVGEEPVVFHLRLLGLPHRRPRAAEIFEKLAGNSIRIGLPAGFIDYGYCGCISSTTTVSELPSSSII